MNILETYFADHLTAAADHAPSSAALSRVTPTPVRMVLFKIGQIRFALPSTAIAAYTRAPEEGCHYVAGHALVPARYGAAAAIDADHQHYIHLAGTRFGIGPCRADGELVVDDAALAPRIRHEDEPWIVATLTDPPSLVLEKQALSARLLKIACT